MRELVEWKKAIEERLQRNWWSTLRGRISSLAAYSSPGDVDYSLDGSIENVAHNLSEYLIIKAAVMAFHVVKTLDAFSVEQISWYADNFVVPVACLDALKDTRRQIARGLIEVLIETDEDETLHPRSRYWTSLLFMLDTVTNNEENDVGRYAREGFNQEVKSFAVAQQEVFEEVNSVWRELIGSVVAVLVAENIANYVAQHINVDGREDDSFVHQVKRQRLHTPSPSMLECSSVA